MAGFRNAHQLRDQLVVNLDSLRSPLRDEDPYAIGLTAAATVVVETDPRDVPSLQHTFRETSDHVSSHQSLRRAFLDASMIAGNLVSGS